MSTLPIPDPPKPSGGDVAHSLVRGGLSSIPYGGGVVGETFNMLVTPPLEKRRRRWEEQMVQVVKVLAEGKHVDIAALGQNEAFNSLLIQATIAAMKTHLDEKLASLRNAVANAALGQGPGDDLSLLFIRFVDEMTPLHLRVLKVVAEHEAKFAFVEGYGQFFDQFSKIGAVEIAPELFKLVCEDLKARMLLRISEHVADFDGLYEESSLLIEGKSPKPKLIVTKLGRKFIEFVLTDRTA